MLGQADQQQRAKQSAEQIRQLARMTTVIARIETFNIQLSILAITVVILGGLGNVLGAVLGALLLIGLPESLPPPNTGC